MLLYLYQMPLFQKKSQKRRTSWRDMRRILLYRHPRHQCCIHHLQCLVTFKFERTHPLPFLAFPRLPEPGLISGTLPLWMTAVIIPPSTHRPYVVLKVNTALRRKLTDLESNEAVLKKRLPVYEDRRMTAPPKGVHSCPSRQLLLPYHRLPSAGA